MKRKKIDQHRRTIKLRSASLNDWNAGMNMHVKGTSGFFLYTVTWDQHGPCAYAIQEFGTTEGTELYVVKFTTHFFKRYNERLELGATDIAKIIKHFFAGNVAYKFFETTSELMAQTRCFVC